jgi:hypothetical protein
MQVDASSCKNLQAAKNGLMGFPSWSREFDSPRSLYRVLFEKKLQSGQREGGLKTPNSEQNPEKTFQPSPR